MASLNGTKIKDTYGTLLKLESSPVPTGSTTKVVEDGLGNDTALKVSDSIVETSGNLKISGTVATSTTVNNALVLETDGTVKVRNLSTSPIGTASITANSPLSATGSTVEVVDAGTLNQITSPANDDKFLIWDESASAYRYIDKEDLTDSISSSINASQPQQIVARVGGTDDSVTIGTASTTIAFAEIHGDSSATGSTSAATSSIMFGSDTNNIFDLSQVSVARDAISCGENTGQYEITAVVQLSGAGGHEIQIEIYDAFSDTVLAIDRRVVEDTKFYNSTFSHVHFYDHSTDSGVRFQLRVSANTAGSSYLKLGTYLKIRSLGSNISF